MKMKKLLRGVENCMRTTIKKQTWLNWDIKIEVKNHEILVDAGYRFDLHLASSIILS